MVNEEIKVIEKLMDRMDQGFIYIDEEKKIRHCNRKAKEITGIIINSGSKHESGKIEEGDIVILADNSLGEDDGELGRNELELLNIRDNGIEEGDALVAVGVYKNKKIEAQYKYQKKTDVKQTLNLDVNYYGFHIESSIDKGKKETQDRKSVV